MRSPKHDRDSVTQKKQRSKTNKPTYDRKKPRGRMKKGSGTRYLPSDDLFGYLKQRRNPKGA
jgi:hypothetical protein